MSRIASFEVFAAELPLKKPFKHAAAERHTSYSLFLKCTTGSGAVGFGGRPPTRPDGPGLGIRVDEDLLRKHSEQSFEVK